MAATVHQPCPKARVQGEVRGLAWSLWELGWGLLSWTEVPVCGAERPGRPDGLVVTGLLATNTDSPRGCPAEGALPALPVRVASWLCCAGDLLGCCQAGPLLAPRQAGQPPCDCSLLGRQWDVGLGRAPPSPGLEQATPVAVDRTWVAACDLSGRSARAFASVRRAMAQKWGVTQSGQGERTEQSALETEGVALGDIPAGGVAGPRCSAEGVRFAELVPSRGTPSRPHMAAAHAVRPTRELLLEVRPEGSLGRRSSTGCAPGPQDMGPRL